MSKVTYNGIEFISPDYDNSYEYRKKTLDAIKQGKLMKKPCEICNDINVTAHHEVYSDYLNVRWLCRSCHSTIHGLLRGQKYNPSSIIVWSELSRYLTGDRTSIRANSMPKKYRTKVNQLINIINNWQES